MIWFSQTSGLQIYQLTWTGECRYSCELCLDVEWYDFHRHQIYRYISLHELVNVYFWTRGGKCPQSLDTTLPKGGYGGVWNKNEHFNQKMRSRKGFGVNKKILNFFKILTPLVGWGGGGWKKNSLTPLHVSVPPSNKKILIIMVGLALNSMLIRGVQWTPGVLNRLALKVCIIRLIDC